MSPEHSLLHVVIATDLPVVSHGVAATVATTNWATTHAVCRTPNEILTAIPPHVPSALVIFLSGKLFLRCNISTWLNNLRRHHPSVPVLLAVDQTEAPFFLRNGMLLGVRALLSLNFEPEEMLRALGAIRHGQVFTSQELLTSDFRYQTTGVHGLTPRERDVLEKFARGLTLSEIAQMANRSVKTISLQKQSAFRKLGFRGSADLHRFYSTQLNPSTDALATEPSIVPSIVPSAPVRLDNVSGPELQRETA
jgi:two-component system capsular synthesis response regulator RcsB